MTRNPNSIVCMMTGATLATSLGNLRSRLAEKSARLGKNAGSIYVTQRSKAEEVSRSTYADTKAHNVKVLALWGVEAVGGKDVDARVLRPLGSKAPAPSKARTQSKPATKTGTLPSLQRASALTSALIAGDDETAWQVLRAIAAEAALQPEPSKTPAPAPAATVRSAVDLLKAEGFGVTLTA